MQNRKSKLLQRIDEKLATTKAAKTKPTPSTRAESNRANGDNSTGPKTAEGKARASANSLKQGFYANAASLHPHDNLAYQDNFHNLRTGLQPDGPVEEMLIRELAMFTTRLKRLEAAEYALICSDIETNPNDAREMAAAFVNNGEALDRLHKAEVHLRRAYNRSWDRLERMQKERHKLPLNESLKRSQVWLTAEALRTNRPKDIPSRHPDIDEKGQLKKYPQGHPLYRPKNEDKDDHEDDKSQPKDR